MAYTLCIAAGVVLAMIARRLAPAPAHAHSLPLAVAAVTGALGGAMLLEFPADWLGWTAPGAGQPALAHGVGGRTVLGGILGGWIAVEIAKPRLGIRVPTGDGFAVPLAVALACGRVGCALTGCCAGRPVEAGAWWRALALVAPDGVARFPAPVAEAVFHAAAAIVLLVLVRRGVLRGRLLAVYVGAYCIVRVLLEEVRENPPVLGRWTYYQLLAVPLFVLAVVTLLRRTLASVPGEPVPPPTTSTRPPPYAET